MKPKTLVLLTVAAGCGLLAMLGIQQAMQGGQAAAAVPKTKVLVAAQDILPGVVLTKELVAFKEMPVTSAPEDGISTEEEYVERALIYPVMAGDIIRQSKLSEKGGGGRSLQIPKGMRVISIPVNDTHTLSGLLQPGDRVDVLVTYKSRNTRGGSVTKTKTLLEYTEVFSVDARTVTDVNGETAQSAKIVSLLVTPEQVNYVKLAENKGTLAISWRHRMDDEQVQISEIDETLMEELQGTVGMHESRGEFAGEGDDEFGESETTDVADADQDVSAFLDQQQQQAPPVEEVVQVKPTWTMDVYVGNDMNSHEWEIPEEQLQEEAGAAAGADALKSAVQWMFAPGA
ncbi:hypothetical protein Mal4_50940 [Maioricimonas rarisocia]|uniref:SAF domain-containing protein n=1 Tax=Maioricimonas rarisocia TaxID=2528026 RepID=A0A517ZE44_9PLAN|nr:Flp pilus assembly protein CpaB [Maioricimonas rarisocia]QDU40734.1 hypothetical protein Mal4_50940 [Maioricimonas rarisocia]